MRKSIIAALLVFSLFNSGRAEEVAIPGTSVTFDAPEGFTTLTAQEIAGKFPANRAPKFVVGNKRRTTTIAYDLKPHKISADELEEFKGTLEQLFKQLIPGLAWKDKKMIELAGQEWIFLEMTSTAVDTDIHNIMLATPHKGALLIFNFNSTKEEFPEVEKSLRKSLKSISIK